MPRNVACIMDGAAVLDLDGAAAGERPRRGRAVVAARGDRPPGSTPMAPLTDLQEAACWPGGEDVRRTGSVSEGASELGHLIGNARTVRRA